MTPGGRNGGSAEPNGAGWAPVNEAQREMVRVQLERILRSSPFKTSKRCPILLRYVVGEALSGRQDRLKERTIGVDVFGRDADYDTNQEPVVRSAAGEVRKRLAQYYLDPDHEQELRIVLPPGAYAPEFVPPKPEPAPSPQPPAARRRKRSRYAWALAPALAAALAAIYAMGRPAPPSALEQFWAPVMDSPGQVLLCVGQPRAYNFQTPLQDDIERTLERSPAAGGRPQLNIPLREVVPMWDRFVTLGDAMCLARLSALFQLKHKPYRIRGGASTGFSDLRDSPAVLIGAFNNEWTLRLAGPLRFSFETDRHKGYEMVRDRQNPSLTDWRLDRAWPGWKIARDFAVVSRVLDPNTDKMLVIAAGITHYGTIAAGEFLTDPAHMAALIRRAPPDWARRNIQVVLTTEVIGSGSGAPRILAAHFW